MNNFTQEINMQFIKFVSNYDLSNSNIVRKIAHCFTVAETCFEIASKLQLNQRDRNIAYACGILHDIGRFEQWKLYKTYDDNNSIDHGDLSFDTLKFFDLSEFSMKDLMIIKTVIKFHTKKLENKDIRTKQFYDILTNADAFANVINTANGSQQINLDENGFSPEILDDFLNFKCLRKYSPKTKFDRAIMLTACTYYVTFPFLRRQILEYNLIDSIAQTFSKRLNKSDSKKYIDTIEVFKEKYINLTK